MSEANTWRGVLSHLSKLDNHAGKNGLSTWAVEDDGRWKFDLFLLNRRDVTFKYGIVDEEKPEAQQNIKTTGGRAWEADVPGPAFGLPPATSVKLYSQETTPDIGILLSGALEFSFQAMFERLGAKIIAHPAVQRVLGQHWGRLFPLFDRIASNAPSIEISGAIGLGAGIAMESRTPYVRVLTSSEIAFNTGLAGAIPLAKHAARATDMHQFARGGGRSWQISSMANIPARM